MPCSQRVMRSLCVRIDSRHASVMVASCLGAGNCEAAQSTVVMSLAAPDRSPTLREYVLTGR